MIAIVIMVATVSVRSHAASTNPIGLVCAIAPADDMAAAPGDEADIAADANAPRLLPLVAAQETAFGRFIRPSAPPLSESLPNGDSEACPPDTVEVDGEYCPFVDQRCLRWLDSETKLQCAEFDKRAPTACSSATAHEHFCIDRYEWPNRLGDLPVSMTSWREAKASCESAGKRLCSDTEWTLACEGPDRKPYPYGDGYARDADACNIDRPYIWPHNEKLIDPKTTADELARLDQREPSGSRASCVSPYGVHDMTGNVDEWVVNVSQGGKPFASGLKGGYWGPVRTRCRPMTTAHDETFRYYQIGFRCCGDTRPIALGEGPLASQ
ncbi:MAG: formylglycine-generating enzyme family protein [Polyangiaceae bacterium]|nr:formylglycine-generating enzyme family protein [Polyangiaceae bacterium]